MARPADSERKWFKTFKLISATWEVFPYKKKDNDNLNNKFTFQPLKVTDLDC